MLAVRVAGGGDFSLMRGNLTDPPGFRFRISRIIIIIVIFNNIYSKTIIEGQSFQEI